MKITHQLHNLASFRPVSEGALMKGDIYVHGEHLAIRGADGDKVFLCPLSGDKAGVLGAASASYGASRLSADLHFTVEALSAPIEPPRRQSWHGLLVLVESGWSLAGSLPRMLDDPEHGGNHAITFLGEIESYVGPKGFILDQWRVTWIDKHGQPVVTIKRAGPAASSATM